MFGSVCVLCSNGNPSKKIRLKYFILFHFFNSKTKLFDVEQLANCNVSLDSKSSASVDTEQSTTSMISQLERRVGLLMIKLMKKLLANYPFLHKIGFIYVNLHNRKISVNIKGKQEKILTSHKRGKVKSSNFKLDAEAFDHVQELLLKKYKFKMH